MRKILSRLLVITSATIFLYSCQKEANDKLPDNKVSSDNPAKLSASIRVWHGQRTTGNIPAPTGNLPALDPSANPEVKAFAGRYAIIKPELISGEVAGYYVGIAGAGQYFKVDYTKPRNIAGRNIFPGRRTKSFLRPQDGNADSSIVIVLPSNIQVPDTFCVTYSAYDSAGNIGPAITTCIIVTSLGGDVNSAWIQNKWNMTAQWEIINGQVAYHDTIIYNKWNGYSWGGYCCFTDSSTSTSWIDHAFFSGGTSPVIVNDSIYYRKAELRFATNGAMDYQVDEDDKFLNLQFSTCTQFNFFPIETWTEKVTGGWSYNSTTGKMILIVEFDDTGATDPDVWEYDVIKVSNTHWILRDTDASYEDLYRWQR